MRSQPVSVLIEQPFDEVYRFLLDPLNFPSWGPVLNVDIHHIGAGDWLVELPRGHAVMRFTEPNLYGVLDFRIIREGVAPGPAVSVRLTPNGEACELTILWLQQPGVSDQDYAQELERIGEHLSALKTMLER